jgi:hypothetical protein
VEIKYLMVSADRQPDLQRKTQNYAGNECISLTLWCDCLTIFEVVKKKFSYSECVSIAICKKHVKKNCRINLTFMPCLARLYFSTLSHRRQFSEKKSVNINTVLGLCITTFGKVYIV